MPSNATTPTFTRSSSQLAWDYSDFHGTLLEVMAYGVHVSVFVSCLYWLQQVEHRHKLTNLNLTFVTAIFVLGTIAVGTDIRMAELQWVASFGYNGGGDQWLLDVGWTYALHAVTLVCYVIAFGLSDAYLLYRVYVIWDRNRLVVAFPAFLWISAFLLGLANVVWETSSEWPITMAWISSTCSFTILQTALIVYRLLSKRATIQRAYPNEHYGKIYQGLVAIMIESAIPYAVTCIIFLVTYGANAPFSNTAFPLLAQTACISPALIVLRATLSAKHPTIGLTAPLGNGVLHKTLSVTKTTEKEMWRDPSLIDQSHYPPVPTSPLVLGTSPTQVHARKASADVRGGDAEAGGPDRAKRDSSFRQSINTLLNVKTRKNSITNSQGSFISFRN